MSVYRFGEFMLDTRSGELHRGSYRIRLRPQPAAVLEYFVTHPGEVVTRIDLRHVLWPDGTFVHFDHGLNSCIKQLRAALLDSRITPQFLETLPRRGYRFICPVSRDAGGPADPDRPNERQPAVFNVAGTARLDGSHMRVNIQLIDVKSGMALWSAEFDCEADDVRGSQGRVAAEIFDGVAEVLRGEPRGTVAKTVQADAVMM